MPDFKQIASDAVAFGFSNAAILDVSTIRVVTAVRDTCASDKCKRYNKNWACPPACGTLEECEARLRRFDYGIIVQTTGKLENSFDYEGIMSLHDQHDKNISGFYKLLKEKNYKELIPLGAGGCKICEKCSCPDSPCRFPDLMITSMEAYGMIVSEVCRLNNIPYYYGEGTLTYVGCYLIK